MKQTLLFFLSIFISLHIFAQGSSTYNGGFKVKLNEDGTQYFRLISWHQVWMRYNDNNAGSTRLGENQSSTTDFGLRRSRFLMYGKMSDRFLIVTHFGINNQNAISGGYLGTDGKKPQIYMHDAWGDYTVIKKYLNVGFGLHYWNGISRLTNASTLNLMAYDAPILNWATIEATDQFARQIGMYAKGKIGKLDYRLALNDPFETNSGGAIAVNRALYNPANNKKVFAGYFMYQFLDEESNLLPYLVGTYVGTKKVFNIGAGFHQNANGMWYQNTAGDTVKTDITLFAADVFLDMPLSDTRKDAITAYAAYYNYNFGPNNYRNIGILNPADGSNISGSLRGNAFPLIGTGQIIYTQVGYLLPKFSDEVRVQPYSAFSHANLEGVKNTNNQVVPVNVLDIGANFFLDGHHSKFTLNYRSRPDFTNPNSVTYRPEVTLQAMIYL